MAAVVADIVAEQRICAITHFLVAWSRKDMPAGSSWEPWPIVLDSSPEIVERYLSRRQQRPLQDGDNNDNDDDDDDVREVEPPQAASRRASIATPAAPSTIGHGKKRAPRTGGTGAGKRARKAPKTAPAAARTRPARLASRTGTPSAMDAPQEAATTIRKKRKGAVTAAADPASIKRPPRKRN